METCTNPNLWIYFLKNWFYVVWHGCLVIILRARVLKKRARLLHLIDGGASPVAGIKSLLSLNQKPWAQLMNEQ